MIGGGDLRLLPPKHRHEKPFVNIQPYRTPDQHWPPKLTLWWFHLAKFWRLKALRKQKIESIQLEGLEHLESSLRSKHGILMAPNHSFHYDSYCLLEAADRLSTPSISCRHGKSFI